MNIYNPKNIVKIVPHKNINKHKLFTKQHDYFNYEIEVCLIDGKSDFETFKTKKEFESRLEYLQKLINQ